VNSILSQNGKRKKEKMTLFNLETLGQQCEACGSTTIQKKAKVKTEKDK
jgi:hypothetical protein